MTRHKDFYTEAINEARMSLPYIRPTPNIKEYMLATAMYLRGIEIAESIQILDNSKNYNAFSVLLRSLIELHMDFLLLFVRDNCFETMRVKEIPSEIEVQKALGNVEKADSLRHQLESLRSKGYRRIGRKEKAKILQEHLADSGDTSYELMYEVIYRSLCAETHNSTASLLDSHLERINNKYYAKSGTNMPDSRLNLYRDQVGRTICLISRLIHPMYRNGKDEIFQKLLNKYNMARSA